MPTLCLTLSLPNSRRHNFRLQVLKEMVSPSNIIMRIQRLECKQCSLHAVAHFEPPHQGVRCLQFELFSSLVFKDLMPKIKIESHRNRPVRRNSIGVDWVCRRGASHE